MSNLIAFYYLYTIYHFVSIFWNNLKSIGTLIVIISSGFSSPHCKIIVVYIYCEFTVVLIVIIPGVLR